MVLKRGLALAQVFTRARLSSDMQWSPLFPLTVCVTVDGPPGRTPCRLLRVTGFAFTEQLPLNVHGTAHRQLAIAIYTFSQRQEGA
jgi:hypothetical protein